MSRLSDLYSSLSYRLFAPKYNRRISSGRNVGFGACFETELLFGIALMLVGLGVSLWLGHLIYTKPALFIRIGIWTGIAVSPFVAGWLYLKYFHHHVRKRLDL